MPPKCIRSSMGRGQSFLPVMLVKCVRRQLRRITAGSGRQQTLPGKSDIQWIWIFNGNIIWSKTNRFYVIEGKKRVCGSIFSLPPCLVFSCESDAQLEWVGLGQVRTLLVWGAGRASSKSHGCTVASWRLMGAKGMRGRTEMSCGRGRHMMKMKRLDKLKFRFAENTPVVKMLC